MSQEQIFNLLSSEDKNIEFNIENIETIECNGSVDLTKYFLDTIGVIILESSRFNLIINEETVISNDSMIIIGTGVSIRVSPIDLNLKSIKIMSLNYSNSEELKHINGECCCYQPINILPYIEKFNVIQNKITTNDLASKVYTKIILYEFIYSFIKEYSYQSESTDLYSKIKTYIDGHYTDTLSIQFLSDLFGTSYNTLERKFKANSGLTPQQYITDLRMRKACEYLKETNLNIETIALALGFQDKFYFSRAFKKKMNATPGAYRTTHTTIPKSSSTLQVQSSDKRNIVISNYNRVTVYRMIPKRIVCLSYFAAEVCVALGLADRIIGMVETEGSLTDCKSEYREIIEGIYKIPKNNKPMPEFDEIDSMLPDFVYGASCSFLEQSGIADANEFEKHGMNIYVSKATYSTLSTMHDVYEDIYSIGKIFSKTEQARLIVKEMQSELQMIKEKLGDLESKRVFLYTSEIDGKALTVGMGLESYLLKLAKGANIFENYPQQRLLREWAEVAKENPEIIIIHASEDDEPSAIAKKLMHNEFLKNVSAIKNNHVYSIRLEHIFPGLHNIDVIKQFAFYIHGFRFDEKI